jgi:hypothetical protein
VTLVIAVIQLLDFTCIQTQDFVGRARLHENFANLTGDQEFAADVGWIWHHSEREQNKDAYVQI